MTAQETFLLNRYRTTLAQPVGATDLTFHVQDTTGLVLPCYLVVDPDDDAKAEYFLVDSAITGTTLVMTATSKRHLAGSAAISGLTHSAGAAIRMAPLAQHFEDLNDRVDGMLPKAGGTMSGPVVFGDQLLSRAVLSDIGETVHDLGTTSGTVTIDYTNGPWQRFVANGAVTLAFTNFPADGTGGAVLVEMKQDATGSRTLTYPAEVEHEGDVAPAISTAASKTDLHVFLTRTGGTKVYHPKPKLGFTP